MPKAHSPNQVVFRSDVSSVPILRIVCTKMRVMPRQRIIRSPTSAQQLTGKRGRDEEEDEEMGDEDEEMADEDEQLEDEALKTNSVGEGRRRKVKRRVKVKRRRRTKAKLCPLYQMGGCTKGEDCPDRHVLEDELNDEASGFENDQAAASDPSEFGATPPNVKAPRRAASTESCRKIPRVDSDSSAPASQVTMAKRPGASEGVQEGLGQKSCNAGTIEV